MFQLMCVQSGVVADRGGICLNKMPHICTALGSQSCNFGSLLLFPVSIGHRICSPAALCCGEIGGLTLPEDTVQRACVSF